jgi:WD40 repeat protein
MKTVRCLLPVAILFAFGCGNDTKQQGSAGSEASTSTKSKPDPAAALKTKDGATLTTENSKCWALRFSPDGKLLAIGLYKKIELWDLTSFTSKATLTGPTDRVGSISFTPDGQAIAATWEKGEEIKVWDVASGKEKTPFKCKAGVIRIAFTSDGKILGADNGERWEVQSGKALKQIGDNDFTFCALSPSGDVMAGSDYKSEYCVFNMSSGKRVAMAKNLSGRIKAVSEATKTLVLKGDKDNLSLVDFSGKKRADLPGKLDGASGCVELSADGHMLAAGMDGNILQLWDVESGKPIGSVEKFDALSAAFSKDGKLFAASSGDGYGKHKVWELSALLAK